MFQFIILLLLIVIVYIYIKTSKVKTQPILKKSYLINESFNTISPIHEEDKKIEILEKCFENVKEKPFFTKYKNQTYCDIYDDKNIACYTPLEYISEIQEFDPESIHLIHNICVDPSMRNKGIGKQLVKRQIEIAKNKGKKKCVLQVKADNIPAVTLYKKMGFTIDKTFRSIDTKFYHQMIYLIVDSM